MTELSKRIIEAIRSVPAGRVASYGEIARIAGNPRAARQVVRVLHTFSKSENLAWHRIVGSDGSIRLPSTGGLEEQASLLAEEGVEFSVSRDGLKIRISMEEYSIAEK